MSLQPTLFTVQTEIQSNAPLTIKELPHSDQPLNRLTYLGTGSLSLLELLALLIGGNNGLELAGNLLRKADTLTAIAQVSMHDLTTVPGIGPSTAARIKASMELAIRLCNETPEETTQVRSPADVANLVMLEMGLLDHEQLRVVLLDTKNRIRDVVTVYKGSLNQAIVRVGELFKAAVQRQMAAIILVHNHPSGDPTPSPEDVRVTQKVVQAGELLNIDVLDHIVIGKNRWVSLKERGLGF